MIEKAWQWHSSGVFLDLHHFLFNTKIMALSAYNLSILSPENFNREVDQDHPFWAVFRVFRSSTSLTRNLLGIITNSLPVHSFPKHLLWALFSWGIIVQMSTVVNYSKMTRTPFDIGNRLFSRRWSQSYSKLRTKWYLCFLLNSAFNICKVQICVPKTWRIFFSGILFCLRYRFFQ